MKLCELCRSEIEIIDIANTNFKNGGYHSIWKNYKLKPQTIINKHKRQPMFLVTCKKCTFGMTLNYLETISIIKQNEKN
jgi:hypothetical protein